MHAPTALAWHAHAVLRIMESAPIFRTMTEIRNNTAASRYELDAGDAMALLYYRIADGVMTIVHTETPPQAQGQGVASRLMKQALDDAREAGLKVAPRCPFAGAYMGRHPEYNDLLA